MLPLKPYKCISSQTLFLKSANTTSKDLAFFHGSRILKLKFRYIATVNKCSNVVFNMVKMGIYANQKFDL